MKETAVKIQIRTAHIFSIITKENPNLEKTTQNKTKGNSKGLVLLGLPALLTNDSFQEYAICLNNAPGFRYIDPSP
jgi:hypothetical protein